MTGPGGDELNSSFDPFRASMRGYQSQVKWAGRVPQHAYAWPRALHSRFAGARLRAGELSRGVGLRGFEIDP